MELNELFLFFFFLKGVFYEACCKTETLARPNGETHEDSGACAEWGSNSGRRAGREYLAGTGHADSAGEGNTTREEDASGDGRVRGAGAKGRGNANRHTGRGS